MKKIIKYLLFINSIFIIIFISSCSKNKDINNNNENINNIVEKPPLGTWWWNKNLDINDYLSFAKNNNVTEIYFCDYSLGNNLKELLEKANNYSIKIYLLAGEKEWLNDRSNLDTIINNYILTIIIIIF